MAYICSCTAVRDVTVINAIAAGARCVDDVAAMCSAGGDCGSCHPVLQELIESHGLEQQPGTAA